MENEIYVPDFLQVTSFYEKGEKLLFYADLKIDLANGKFLYANAYRLGIYKSFHDFFTDSNVKKDAEGFFHFHHPDMICEEVWLPILNLVYNGKEEARKSFVKLMEMRDFDLMDKFVGFLEAFNIMDIDGVFIDIFTLEFKIEYFDFYQIFSKYSKFGKSFNYSLKNFDACLEKMFFMGIIKFLKESYMENGPIVFTKMNILEEKDFQYACSVISSLGTGYRELSFLFLFKNQILREKENRKLIDFSLFEVPSILTIAKITLMVERIPVFVDEILCYCSKRIRIESNPSTPKKAKVGK